MERGLSQEYLRSREEYCRSQEFSDKHIASPFDRQSVKTIEAETTGLRVGLECQPEPRAIKSRANGAEMPRQPLYKIEKNDKKDSGLASKFASQSQHFSKSKYS